MTLAGWLETEARRVWSWIRRGGKERRTPKPETSTLARWFRFPWWLTALALLLSCALPTAEGLVSVANPEWLAGYQEAERCSGRVGHVERVRWHVVPDSSAVMQRGKLVGYRQGDDIYLAEDWAGQRWLARHESLHHLGFAWHDPALFAGRCHATWGAIDDTLGVTDAG